MPVARVFVTTLLLALLCSAAALADVGIGINYNWWSLTLTSLKECKADGEPQTVGNWMLPHYQDARVRRAVQTQLKAMRRSGFTTLRTLVFFYHDSAPATDSFTSLDGSIATADRTKLRDFVSDIRAAGFTTLEVVPSFQAENELFCRNAVWGDCFEPKRTDENWRFISQVVSVVTPAAGPLALRFDLGNEQAPDPRMPARSLANAKTYLQTVAGRFQKAYGGSWLISAARSDGSPASETSDRFELLLTDLGQVGLVPKYLELHTYSPDGNDAKLSLDAADAIARRIGAKTILGELRYHSDAQASAIAAWLAEHPQSSVVDLIQWPEYDPSHVCAIDPSPPYTPGVLGRLLGVAAPPAPAAAGEQTWLAVSDIHLDPAGGDPQPSLVGSDTNAALFASAIAEMKRRVPDPAVVLLPGDFFAHDFTRDVSHTDPKVLVRSGVRTMQLVASAFARAFPRAQFAIALGNNDAPCGDYRSDAGSAYLAAVARVWAPLVDRRGAAPDFASSFARNGYYTAALPVRGLRLVVLDTVLLSSEYRGTCADGSGSAASELAWLNATLGATPNGTRNLVMMHVPPGYDTFTTQALLGQPLGGVRVYRGVVDDIRGKLSRLSSMAAPWPFLDLRDNASLIDALNAPQHRVAWALAGHAHRFDFRLAGATPIVVLGALSPVYHDNPAFYALHVGANGSLRDLDTYAFDEEAQGWAPARSFDQTWGVTSLDAPPLAGLHARLGADPALRAAWDAASNGWPANPQTTWVTWGALWRVPWCAQTTLADGFAKCAGIERRVFLLRAAAVIAIALIVAVPAVIALLILRRRRHVSR
jgi:hypothetical protein